MSRPEWIDFERSDITRSEDPDAGYRAFSTGCYVAGANLLSLPARAKKPAHEPAAAGFSHTRLLRPRDMDERETRPQR